MGWLRFPLVKRSKTKTHKARALSRPRLAFELLEGRICPSVFYDFNVIATVGQANLTGIEQSASINDKGKVAFIGDLAGGQGIFVGDGTTLTNIDSLFVSSSRHLGTELEINNSNQVAVGDSHSGGGFNTAARIYDANNPNNFTNIALGSSPLLRNSDFDAVASFVSIANDGKVALAGLNNNTWDIHQSAALVKRSATDSLITSLPSNNGSFFRMMSANNNRVVVGWRTFTQKQVLLYDNNAPQTLASIATTAGGNWTDLGVRPGISEDGNTVAFYGNLSAPGATALNAAQPGLPALSAGAGIFVSVPTGAAVTSRVIVRVAGTASDLGYDANNNPITFGSFDVDSRVAVIDEQLNGLQGATAANDSLVIAFGGTPGAASRNNPQTGKPLLFSANDGLWTVRLDVDADLVTPATLRYHATSPIPVVQVGDKINGAAVTGIFTSDPLSNATRDWVNGMGAIRTPMKGDHMVAFVASTAAGNMVVRASHLDTDQDGLLDHWETKGIYMDPQNDRTGPPDLNLKAMGASPTKRDLFLEADWTRPRNGPDAADKWSDAPNAGVFQSLVNMFAAAPALPNGVPAGVTVHIDGGPGNDEAGNPYSINMGTGSLQGGDQVGQPGSPGTHIDVVNFGTPIPAASIPAGVQVRSFDDIKKNFFGTNDNDARELAFHYVVFADFQDFLRNGAGNPFTSAVSAATANTVSAPGAPFAGANLPGMYVMITSGKGAGRVRAITANTANQLTVTPNWGTIPDNTSTLTLFSGSSGLSEVSFRADNSAVPGNDLLITLGGWGVNAAGKLATAYIEWRTVAHELGHTMGLRHGGIDHTTCDPSNSAAVNNMLKMKYKSLMSYCWQLDGPPPTVNSYSGATDPTFNDWANLEMDFQNALSHTGNTFGNGDATTVPADSNKPDQTVFDYQTMNNMPVDLEAPTVSIDAPAANASIAPGQNLTVNLTATDNVAVDHVTVSFDINGDGNTTDPGETVSATQTGPTIYAATFANVSGPVGSRTITATAFDTSLNPAGTTTAITVSSVGKLAIANLSSTSVTAGGTVTFVVTAQDGSGQPVPSYTGTVLITSTDSNAMFNGSPLPGSYTFTAADSGSHMFTVALDTAASQTITVTDQASSSLTASTGPITVNAGPFSKFLVSVLGGSTVSAGNSFLFTVQAADQFGNPVTSYSGPASVTTTTTPVDSQSTFPITGALNSSGFGFFLGNLKTAGSYTLTATASTFTGASGSLAVTPASATYFTVAAPAAATTGTPFNVAVEAFDFFGNVASAYTGHVHFSSSDGGATLPIDSTLTSGMGTFNVTLNSAGNQTITATDTVSTNPTITGTGSAVTTRGLVVSTFTPTATGFTVTFSKPFIPGDLTLYGSSLATVPDVALIGAKSGPIAGTLLIDPANTAITFKATANSLSTFFTAPVLPDDAYTVTLVSGSGSNGFLDALNQGLDGANNGGHANYTTTFTIANQGKPILSISDFARGPDGAHTIQVPNDSAGGIPVTLYNAAGVTDVAFTLSYNPSLLAVAGGGTSDATGAGSAFTLLGSPLISDATHATANFHFQNSTPQSGTVVLGDILANVPNSAAMIYKTKELLGLGTITVNGSTFTGLSAGGVHVNAYFGDVTGNGTIDGLDVATANTLARGAASGFNAFTLLDPAIVGDVANDISVDAGDVSDLAAFTVHLPTPVIPAIPTGLAITPVGADPTLSLGEPQRQGDKENGRQGDGPFAPGLTYTVPVLLDHPHPMGSTGMTEAVLALIYDPSLLSVSPADITLGSLPHRGAGWQLSSQIDQATGQIGITLFSLTPITATEAGSLVEIAFHTAHVRPEPAKAGTPIVQLVSSTTINAQQFATQVDDAQGQLVLSPGINAIGERPGVRLPVIMAAATDAEVLQVVNGSQKMTGAAPMDAETSHGRGPDWQEVQNGWDGLDGRTAQSVVIDEPNMAFQIGNLPILNAFLYRNSPARVAADGLFRALARRLDGSAELAEPWESAAVLAWDSLNGLDVTDGIFADLKNNGEDVP